MLASDDQLDALGADYCVINGLFTVKSSLSDEEMWLFMTRVVNRLWRVIRKGIAFNVMSKQVDHERSDLFHVSFDRLAEFVHSLAGRNIVFRADYGLYEYTCFAFKSARRARIPSPIVPTPSDHRSAAVSSSLPHYPVCRPLLPNAERLRPYLETIDQRRWYSNWGALTLELEHRLCRHFGLPEGCCILASSGTNAITAALIAVAGRASPERPYCLMPSYTFVATAAAALGAGFTPYFLDIDAETLALSPARVKSHPALARTGAILVVAAYGKPIDVREWRELSTSTGVPVVFDAAAGFDAIASKRILVARDLPMVVSLQATKVFGTGEGALILCDNVEMAQRCRRALNFGFLGERRAMTSGINGKMSEFHAAVGLAELDGWPTKRAAFMRVAQAYWRAARKHGLDMQFMVEREWASSYVLYAAHSSSAAKLASERLFAAGIDYRFWYGYGVYREIAYAHFPADPLPVTDDLSTRLIGLPVSVDLSR